MTDASEVAHLAMETVPGAMRRIRMGLRAAGRNTMSPQRLAILRVLVAQDLTLGELADMQGVSAPTMSTAVAALSSEGLLTRTIDPVDRRRVIVSITDLGRTRLATLGVTAEAALARVLADLSQEDLDALAKGLLVLHRLEPGAS